MGMCLCVLVHMCACMMPISDNHAYDNGSSLASHDCQFARDSRLGVYLVMLVVFCCPTTCGEAKRASL